MAIYDLSKDVLAFHDRYVKLDVDDRQRLSRARELNLGRVRDGLAALEKPGFRTCLNQGGYAMQTVVNDPSEQSNHDIDIALIFDADDLPASALQARQRVRDALIKINAGFRDEPEARTNAVTVWYADGYHVDLAVYRRRATAWGEVCEHAGADWVAREPAEVTDWFTKAVDDRSPKGEGVLVRPGQLRRIVRLVKWFSRSRASWTLPGGMIISTLVESCYQPDPERDDKSLYKTLFAVKARLDVSCQVFHPAGDGRELTGKDAYLKQVERLKAKLAMAVGKLAVLETDCTQAQARGAWDWVFNHAYWGGSDVLNETAQLSISDIRIDSHSVEMTCEYTTRGRHVGTYQGGALPKKVGLRFFVTETTVPPPYDIRYEVQNTGEEATNAKTLNWAGNASSYTPSWTTSTAYAGRHRMTCNIVKNGLTLASTSMRVVVGPR